MRLGVARALVSGTLALGWNGCANLAGVDDYEVGTDSSADRETIVAEAFDPSSACTSCVTRECQPEAAACVGDPDCFELYRCQAECGPDPGCRMVCWSAFTVARRAAGRPQIPVPVGSVTLSSRMLAECVGASCADPCRSGRHLECAGNFDWPVPSELSFDHDYLINVFEGGVSRPAVDAAVRLCALGGGDSELLSDRDCVNQIDPESGTSSTDARGIVTIHHRNRIAPAGRFEPEPSYLLVEPPASESAVKRTRMYSSFPAARPSFALYWITAGGLGVGGLVFDCNSDAYNPARGVRITRAGSETPTRYGIYPNVDPAADRTDATGTFVLFSLGETNRVVDIVAEDAETGEQLDAIRIPLHDDSIWMSARPRAAASLKGARSSGERCAELSRRLIRRNGRRSARRASDRAARCAARTTAASGVTETIARRARPAGAASSASRTAGPDAGRSVRSSDCLPWWCRTRQEKRRCCTDFVEADPFLDGKLAPLLVAHHRFQLLDRLHHVGPYVEEAGHRIA